MKRLIIQDSKILGGKPIIAGTRMSVEIILEFLAGGMEIKEMLREYPFLTKKQIQAAIQYAAANLSSDKKSSRSKLEGNETPAILHEIYSRR